MVLGKLPVPGRPTMWMIVGQGPIALTVCAGAGCLDIFTLLYLFSSLSPSLWETARYRLKYCLKGPLNPKQPTKNRFPPRSTPRCSQSVDDFDLTRHRPEEASDFLRYKWSSDGEDNLALNSIYS